MRSNAGRVRPTVLPSPIKCLVCNTTHLGQSDMSGEGVCTTVWYLTCIVCDSIPHACKRVSAPSVHLLKPLLKPAGIQVALPAASCTLNAARALSQVAAYVILLTVAGPIRIVQLLSLLHMQGCHHEGIRPATDTSTHNLQQQVDRRNGSSSKRSSPIPSSLLNALQPLPHLAALAAAAAGQILCAELSSSAIAKYYIQQQQAKYCMQG
jgi:hypothetical protein